jgi:hypothetical protein
MTASNQKFNAYLKEFNNIMKLIRELHTTPRKTFASTVLLYNDVPMEIVSRTTRSFNMTITKKVTGR